MVVKFLVLGTIIVKYLPCEGCFQVLSSKQLEERGSHGKREGWYQEKLRLTSEIGLFLFFLYVHHTI